jgi:hypothetical protein
MNLTEKSTLKNNIGSGRTEHVTSNEYTSKRRSRIMVSQYLNSVMRLSIRETESKTEKKKRTIIKQAVLMVIERC